MQRTYSVSNTKVNAGISGQRTIPDTSCIAPKNESTRTKERSRDVVNMASPHRPQEQYAKLPPWGFAKFTRLDAPVCKGATGS